MKVGAGQGRGMGKGQVLHISPDPGQIRFIYIVSGAAPQTVIPASRISSFFVKSTSEKYKRNGRGGHKAACGSLNGLKGRKGRIINKYRPESTAKGGKTRPVSVKSVQI